MLVFPDRICSPSNFFRPLRNSLHKGTDNGAAE